MVTTKELISRVEDFYKFNRQELVSLIIAVFIFAFMFSFRDWGETFEWAVGIKNLLITSFVVGLSFFFRLSCQKIYALSQGYLAEFKIWWVGVIFSLVLTFLTLGVIPLVLLGTMSVTFMVRQRLGEFRYGMSHKENTIISVWGIVGNLILALLFAYGYYYLPQSYFFHQGLIFNMLMAICALLPLPWLDGLSLFFGSRATYGIMWFTVLLAAALLLTQTKIGLIIALIIGLVAGAVNILISPGR